MAVNHYCTLEDVNALVPQVPFTAVSKPSAEDVKGLIETIATEMDASLANLGYTAPVVEGEQSLRLLRQICSYGVLGIAQSMRGTGVNVAVDASGREGKNIWEQRYRERMAALADDDEPFELPDAPKSDTAAVKEVDQQARTFVDALSSDEFDADHPSVTRNQVW